MQGVYQVLARVRITVRVTSHFRVCGAQHVVDQVGGPVVPHGMLAAVSSYFPGLVCVAAVVIK